MNRERKLGQRMVSGLESFATKVLLLCGQTGRGHSMWHDIRSGAEAV